MALTLSRVASTLAATSAVATMMPMAVVHGFLLRKGVFTAIDVPGASFTSARAINARGDIAGRMKDADGVDHAFLLHDGQFTQVDFPGASSTVGRGINNAGDVTGNYIDSTGTEIGFVLQDGEFQSILANPCSSDVWMAMDNGRVLTGDNCTDPDVGLLGYLRDSQGRFRIINFPIHGSYFCTAPRWINERGDIVGLYVVANNAGECFERKYSTASFYGTGNTQLSMCRALSAQALLRSMTTG